jgi:hypothetical protein
MPFLGRTDYGGPFNAYFEALSNLGSEFVRYAPCTSPTRYPLIRTVLRRRPAQPVINPPPSLLLPPPPGFPNPRVVVTELTPSDCTATGHELEQHALRRDHGRLHGGRLRAERRRGRGVKHPLSFLTAR